MSNSVVCQRNPHAHILLTLRPLAIDGTWGAKCRKEYDLDENGQRIRSESGAYKSHRVDSTDWNDKGKAEIWRSAWSDYVNRSLEQNGMPSPEEIFMQKVSMEQLYKALNALPSQQARRVYERYINQKKNVEIARAEGVHEASTRQSVIRGIENLRKYYAKNGWQL